MHLVNLENLEYLKRAVFTREPKSGLIQHCRSARDPAQLVGNSIYLNCPKLQRCDLDILLLMNKSYTSLGCNQLIEPVPHMTTMSTRQPDNVLELTYFVEIGTALTH